MRFECIDKVSFRLGVNPADLTTAQEKGVRIIRVHGKQMPMFYKKKKALDNEKLLTYAFSPYRFSKPIANDGETAVELKLRYLFPHTSSTPKWKRDELTFMTQRPDADNISKAVVDCMTRLGFWEDDSMVNFHFSKYRSPNPCIMVEILTWKQFKE
jgi:Holliday junction resolvase RusA-like endonuclease